METIERIPMRPRLTSSALAALLLLCLVGVHAEPVTPGLRAWYSPESLVLNASDQAIGWVDRSGSGNNLSVWVGTGIPTSVDLLGVRYVDFAGAQSYSKFFTGEGGVVSDAVGMDSTEFDVFVVASNYQSGDLGAIGHDPLNSNDDKVCFGISSASWVACYGGASYLTIGSAHQGGAIYATKATCRKHQTPVSTYPFIYEGIFGTSGSDTDTAVNGLRSTCDVETAPSWQPASPAPYGAVPRGVILGFNYNKFVGRLYEVLIYNRKLDAAERTQVYDYLDARYRIGCENRAPKACVITGTLSLDDYLGELTSVPIRITLRGANVISETTYLQPGGRFSVPGIEPGIYDIWFSAPHWLVGQISNVEIDGNTELPPIALTNGDCNLDNRVDAADLEIIKQNWNASPLANPHADLNGDGKCNLFDLAVLRDSWNRSGVSPLSGGLTYYVAKNGKDTWSGKLSDPNPSATDGPFATISKAVTAVRQARTDNRQAHIIVRGGYYSLPSAISLKPSDSYLTIQSAPGEQVTISGGRVVTGWTTHQGSIMRASLTSLNLPDYNFRQLYYNGVRQPCARVPDFDPIRPRRGGFAYTTATYSGNTTDLYYSSAVINPQNWAKPNLAIAEWFPSYNYHNTRATVVSIDQTNRIIRASSGTYDITTGDRFFISNVFEELNSPGEWYCDAALKRLYFWPPDGNLLTSRVTVPALTTAFSLSGVPVGMSNVRIRGIAFEDFTGVAISMTGATACEVTACSFKNVGTAVWLGNDTHHCRIAGCDISGTGGRALGGGCDAGQSHRSTYNIIDNNYIYDCGWVDKGNNAIDLWCVANYTVTHNLIHDCPRAAISANACLHTTIAYNHAHHANLETEDSGIVYTVNSWGGWDRWLTDSGNLEARGNVVHHNLLHDSGGYGKTSPGNWRFPYFTWDIYHDLSSSGFYDHDNVVYDTVDGGFMLGGGQDNVCENNVFADATNHQIYGCPWTDRYTMARNFIRHNIVSYNSSTANYYKCSGYSNSQVTFSQNVVYNNGQSIKLSVSGASTWTAWRLMGQDAGSLVTNPLFLDAANRDYRLQPSSPAIGLGIRQVDLSGVGLYESRDRYSWPRPEVPVYREP
jgi:hypothetical protein